MSDKPNRFGHGPACERIVEAICRCITLALLVCVCGVPAARTYAAQQSADATSQLSTAYQLLRDDKLEDALVIFSSELKNHPSNHQLIKEIGYLYVRLRRWPEAAQYLGQAAANEPDNVRLRLDLGYALQNAGDLSGAIDAFRKAASAHSDLREQAAAAVANAQQKQSQLAEMSLQLRDVHLNRGYEMLRAGNRIQACREFELALEQDGSNVSILKQLGFLYIQEKNLQAAVAKFEAARLHAPADGTIALQLGYLYDSLNEPAKAITAFQDATSDAATRMQASTALKNAVRSNRSWYVDVFASPIYMARFNNGIAIASAQLGWRLRRDLPVSLYLSTRVTRDSRSVGGSLPAIFADNVLLTGIGISFRPRGYHFTVSGEVGAATNLVPRAGAAAVQSDFRVTATYFRRWDGRMYGPVGLFGANRIGGERLFSELDTSVGYYSRYSHNGIAYLGGREGVRVARLPAMDFNAYAKYALVKDTHRDFYNNAGEGGLGIEWRPRLKENLSVRAEYLRGAYFGIARDRNPYAPNYNDFRITMLFGHRF